jgi:hypothetical protein
MYLVLVQCFIRLYVWQAVLLVSSRHSGTLPLELLTYSILGCGLCQTGAIGGGSDAAAAGSCCRLSTRAAGRWLHSLRRIEEK